MSAVSSIPKSVQDKSGAAATAQDLAGWVETGVKRGENVDDSIPMNGNVNELKRIVGNDPSLKQYLSTTVKALMDYDGAATVHGNDAANTGKLPQEFLSSDGKAVQSASDRVSQGLRAGEDPEQLAMRQPLDTIRRNTDKDTKLALYLDPTVNALAANLAPPSDAAPPTPEEEKVLHDTAGTKNS